LPLDFPRPVKQDFVGDRLWFDLDENLTSELKRVAADSGATLYMVLLSIFYILLSRLTGQEDLLAGTPVAARRHESLQRIVGVFINTLALRGRPRGDMQFTEFLAEVKEITLQAFENQEYPFDELVGKVAAQSDPSRNPLFDVMFALENTREAMPADDRDDGEDPLIQRPVSRFDMTWNGAEKNGGIIFTVEFRTGLLRLETVTRWMDYFPRIAAQVCKSQNMPLHAVELLTEAERRRLAVEFNGTATDYPSDSSIHELFKRQAVKTPGYIAVIAGEYHVSYDELDRLSDMAAARLVAGGVRLEEVVGLMMPRGIDMVVAMLGILKAGAAYLPIDGDLPESRKRQLREDSNLDIVLTEGDFTDGEFTGDLAAVEDWPAADASSLAYVMYTSGSAGIPKGVMVEHRSVARLVKQADYVEFTPGERLLQTGALEFDASTFEIWGALLNGMALVLADKRDILLAANMKQVLSRHDIHMMWLTAPLFNQLLEADPTMFGRLRWLLVGGDALSPFHVQHVLDECPGLAVVNGYGPTENTTFSTTYRVESPVDRPVPIGRPIADSTAFVLDRRHRVQPVGIFGELWLGGDGVARGYLNRPELTAEKFVDMGEPFGRVYRSGDLARVGGDGLIEFAGRIDQQVKIRGFRVELGEIENWLLKHERVREAVVLATSGGGDKGLVAYLVDAVDIVDPVDALADEVEGYLRGVLPGFMVPSAFVVIAKIPLTANGKVDQGALPEPEVRRSVSVAVPVTRVERRLADLWSDGLGIDSVDIYRDSDFFQLGGHSLKAANLAGRIHKEFSVSIPLDEIFLRPTLRRMAEYIESAGANAFFQIPVVERRDFYPLSSAQKRLFILQMMEPESTVYNVPIGFFVSARIEASTLHAIFSALARRHESLRTGFCYAGGEPVQRVYKHVEFEVEQQLAIRPFDLAEPPLFRIGAWESENGGTFVWLDMHHIITDGLSMEVLVRDFAHLYRGRELEPPAIQYKDFACWQTHGAGAPRLDQSEGYWLWALEGELPVLNVPVDFQRPAVRDYEGDRFVFSLSAGRTAGLQRLAEHCDTTMFVLLLAAFYILLSRLGGGRDIIVGSPVAARSHADLNPVVGMFVNTLPLRIELKAEDSFRNFILRVRDMTLEALHHQDYPFERLVERLEIERDTRRNPLFDVMFSFMNFGEQDAGILEGSLQGDIRPLEISNPISKFDLTLTGKMGDRQLRLEFEYGVKLFRWQTMQRFAGYFTNLLTQLPKALDSPLDDIEIMGVSEKKQLLLEFNSTGETISGRETVLDMFTKHSRRQPDVVALVGAGDPLLKRDAQFVTYRALDRWSGAYAEELSRRGFGAGTVAVVEAERSAGAIVRLLGVFRLRAVYLPVDPNAPQSRLRFIVDDSHGRRIPDDVDIPATSGADWRYPAVDAGDPAYVIYTSGSTGGPKGVVVNHGSLGAVVDWFVRCYGLAPNHRVLQMTAFTFDVSLEEIFGSLCSGATLAIPRREILLQKTGLRRYIEMHGIRLAQFVPVSLREFLGDGPRIGCLDVVICGGDRLDEDLKDLIMGKGYALYNHYGPTETAVDCAAGPCGSGNVDIGRPVAGNRIFILDGTRLQPVGVTGELCVAGAGVAEGYLNRPELSARHFQALDVMGDGTLTRIYRTGDLARWLPDGRIECLGRVDRQVKIRGHRIEPGEIEALLRQHDAVRQVVIQPVKDHRGDSCLCVYFVAGSDEGDIDLRGFLSGRLPHYMMPDYSVRLDALPLTASGKVDRNKLPPPARDRSPAGSVESRPTTRWQTVLAEVWKELLGLERIGIDDNFFELGGNSLKIIQANHKLNEELGLNVPVVKMFEFPTIRAMAAYCDGDGQEEAGDDMEMETPSGEKSGRTLARRRRIMEVDDE
jgi:amino acid adenylation domain-containing protein